VLEALESLRDVGETVISIVIELKETESCLETDLDEKWGIHFENVEANDERNMWVREVEEVSGGAKADVVTDFDDTELGSGVLLVVGVELRDAFLTLCPTCIVFHTPQRGRDNWRA
jgi:hypothetical protein